MKTKYNDFWVTKNNKAANAYMDEIRTFDMQEPIAIFKDQEG